MKNPMEHLGDGMPRPLPEYLAQPSGDSSAYSRSSSTAGAEADTYGYPIPPENKNENERIAIHGFSGSPFTMTLQNQIATISSPAAAKSLGTSTWPDSESTIPVVGSTWVSETSRSTGTTHWGRFAGVGSGAAATWAAAGAAAPSNRYSSSVLTGSRGG